ncbi:MAG: response regulator [Acidobacteria bacterium]|nr:response regulator [Acidobacteriota bacterium]
MATILVIDDEANIRLLYEDVLSEEGYEVLTAESGAEGLQKLREHSVDLVVLDIKLKSESGLDVLQRIVSQYPGLPVILCSAFISFQDDYTSWLAERYVVKSSDPTELLYEVNRVLAQKGER